MARVNNDCLHSRSQILRFCWADFTSRRDHVNLNHWSKKPVYCVAQHVCTLEVSRRDVRPWRVSGSLHSQNTSRESLIYCVARQDLKKREYYMKHGFTWSMFIWTIWRDWTHRSSSLVSKGYAPYNPPSIIGDPEILAYKILAHPRIPKQWTRKYQNLIAHNMYDIDMFLWLWKSTNLCEWAKILATSSLEEERILTPIRYIFLSSKVITYYVYNLANDACLSKSLYMLSGWSSVS